MDGCDYWTAYPIWIADLLVRSRAAAVRAWSAQHRGKDDPAPYDPTRSSQRRSVFGVDPARQFDRATALRIRAIEQRAGYEPLLPGFSAGGRYGRGSGPTEKE
jgi:hypothetical protein